MKEFKALLTTEMKRRVDAQEDANALFGLMLLQQDGVTINEPLQYTSSDLLDRSKFEAYLKEIARTYGNTEKLMLEFLNTHRYIDRGPYFKRDKGWRYSWL